MEAVTVFSRYRQHLFPWWLIIFIIYYDKTFLIHCVFFFPRLPENSNLKLTHIDQIERWFYTYSIVLYSWKYVVIGWLCSMQGGKRPTQITCKRHRAHTKVETVYFVMRKQSSSWHKLVEHVFGWPKSSFGLFQTILWQNPNEFFGQLIEYSSEKFQQSLIISQTLLHIVLIWITT